MGLRGIFLYIHLYSRVPKKIKFISGSKFEMLCWIALRKFKHGLQGKKPSTLW